MIGELYAAVTSVILALEGCREESSFRLNELGIKLQGDPVLAELVTSMIEVLESEDNDDDDTSEHKGLVNVTETLVEQEPETTVEPEPERMVEPKTMAEPKLERTVEPEPKTVVEPKPDTTVEPNWKQ